MVKIYVLTLLLGLISGCVDEDNTINIEKNTVSNSPFKFKEYIGTTGVTGSLEFIETMHRVVEELLVDTVSENFSGARGRLRLIDGKYLVMDGCKHNSCTEKGFFWYEIKSDRAIFVIGEQSSSPTDYFVFVKKDVFDSLPNNFITQVEIWLSESKISPHNMEVIYNETP